MTSLLVYFDDSDIIIQVYNLMFNESQQDSQLIKHMFLMFVQILGKNSITCQNKKKHAFNKVITSQMSEF